MESVQWLLACAVAIVLGAMIVPSCGPRHLSALGNPGDFCTERSSCTDGSECRQTDDGYRCVGGPNDPSPIRSSDVSDVGDEEPTTGTFSVESGGEEDGGTTETDEESSNDEGSNDEYLPPSRRRRGHR